ncbi:hormonally up-regulated neu tumor-associated kinase homolog A [Lepisosteus oculatus]|uniref:hormonally up-regulated neu tumor-associated kinase homolog A n=1 Tax=Lepisosteus oculatus TaxID=7918 RepID=UPI0007404E1A|nr:PREDICTED: hormonally up-regulated neu tumor-associated kinase [Lepisosteus oculatus]XP_015197307.1 PREDICTED: hormonally up-regulated neu tumor-associated kinase [Lepisosteus oculatus]XP_015197308.1 PREDICTED: hormonally up-regulated neu tumor-associated kinase [Lepisosteus oculatus]
MPAAVREMVNDGPRLFGLKTPCIAIESSFPSFAPCPSRESHRTFYHTKRVGNYLIGRKLGEGSFAKVREGLHVMTGETVAVKVIDKRKAKKDSYVTKNLRREGQIQQMIRHPNITQLLDILETENSYYLVMELCRGGNLMDRIYEKKKLEEREAQKYVRQLVTAVEHLHRAGVVHRDLKIENLLLDEDDNIKLIDFGLSNCAWMLGYSDPFSTQCGSPAYAAPELLSKKRYGPKVDVWSIGVNMYAMLTGNLPFTVEPFSLRALHQRMVDKDMNPLPPQLSIAAVNMLRSLLEPDPVKRPNIHQVMMDPWLRSGSPPHGAACLNRIHMKEINHSVLQHMTERLGYKHSDVLSVVLTNRACHTLAVYFLLDKKMRRFTRVFQEEQQVVEKEKKTDVFQTHWMKKMEKITILPKQTPRYLLQNKGLLKDKKSQNNVLDRGLIRTAPNGSEARFGPGGSVVSSSLEYLEIQSLFPHTPQPIRRFEPQPEGSFIAAREGLDPSAPACTGNSWEPAIRELDQFPPAPWQKGTHPAFSHRGHPCILHPPAFQPDSPYLKKATIPCPPALPTPESKTCPSRSDWSSSDTSTAPSSRSGECHDSPKSRGRFPTMGIGQMLKKRNHNFSVRSNPPLGLNPAAPLPSYHMQTLICASGALKTLF